VLLKRFTGIAVDRVGLTLVAGTGNTAAAVDVDLHRERLWGPGTYGA